jgi:O-antigen/teichoic acid export membrane protein
MPLAGVGIVRAAFGLPAGVVALWLGASLEIVVLLQIGISWLALIIGAWSLQKQLQVIDSTYAIEETKWPQGQHLIKWLQNAIPFAIIDGLFTLEWQLDVLLLSLFVDEHQIGLYGVAQAILSVLMVFLYAVDTVVYPLISRVTIQEQSRIGSIYCQLIKIIAISVIPSALMLSFALGWTVPHLLGEEFVPSLIPLYWLIVTWVIHFLNVPSARLLISLGWQKVIAMFVALGVASNVLLNLLFLPSQRIRGPAMARAFSAVAYALLCTVFAIWSLNHQKRKIKPVEN